LTGPDSFAVSAFISMPSPAGSFVPGDSPNAACSGVTAAAAFFSFSFSARRLLRNVARAGKSPNCKIFGRFPPLPLDRPRGGCGGSSAGGARGGGAKYPPSPTCPGSLPGTKNGGGSGVTAHSLYSLDPSTISGPDRGCTLPVDRVDGGIEAPDDEGRFESADGCEGAWKGNTRSGETIALGGDEERGVCLLRFGDPEDRRGRCCDSSPGRRSGDGTSKPPPRSPGGMPGST
jgi:hypothetical protein